MTISAWTKHLADQTDKDNFNQKVRSSKVVLERLQQLMDEELSSIDRDEINVATYENPNWAYRQAHRNGFKNAIRKLNILLDQKDTKTNG